jgi:hypothetical protein
MNPNRITLSDRVEAYRFPFARPSATASRRGTDSSRPRLSAANPPEPKETAFRLRQFGPAAQRELCDHCEQTTDRIARLEQPEQHRSCRRSGWGGAVFGALAGGLLLGPLGALAGGMIGYGVAKRSTCCYQQPYAPYMQPYPPPFYHPVFAPFGLPMQPPFIPVFFPMPAPQGAPGAGAGPGPGHPGGLHAGNPAASFGWGPMSGPGAPMSPASPRPQT